MKKFIIIFIGLSSISIINAQDIMDGLRYSMDEIQGTARFRAMSGAFGALGGDMSAVNINPAGAAIFNLNHASLTFGLSNEDRDVSYFNEVNSSADTNFDLNQIGAVFVFRNNYTDSPWKKFSLGFAYDRSANFNQDWLASGVNPNTSIGNYFLEYAQGRRLDEISAFEDETFSEAYSAIGSLYGFGNQQAFLGFEGYIIDPVNDTDENTQYTSNINGVDFNQQYSLASRGYNGKLAFNFATSYEDKIYFGINLNAHFINYERSTFLRESNSNETSSVRNVNFGNDLLVTGGGFSFQLGAIAKITNEFRVGLSYNSPTWYRISEETSQFLSSTRIDESPVTISPNVINIYPEYRLQTPGKLTGSLAYVFGNKGLISFDYSLKDYSNIQFRPSSDIFFSNLNNQINNTLDTAISYRIGGEYRYKQISFRGGYRFEESPTINNALFGDLNGYSAGLGYNFGGMTIDFAFSHSQRDVNYQLYTVGLTDSAQIDSTFNDFILTLAFNI
ncbi:OmpP1/FadL family transporter [Winogradskyella aurantia]|uniref:Transporter n=1 Tax=Winogradskyella aurantia TaxID=1915063 RepID=A0A265URJ1_9FLAO|nr:outer membrane protein transport protein [Winogradskyella aurantia]OZV67914.1 transporter [Winogradskyella aurantia]